MNIVRCLSLLLVPAVMSNAETALGQVRGSSERSSWKALTISIAAHGAASGVDAWSSWKRPERNGFLADGGRFGPASAYKKAGVFAGAAVLEVLVVRRWSRRHPWIERACRIANYTAAAMLAGAAAHNLRGR